MTEQLENARVRRQHDAAARAREAAIRATQLRVRLARLPAWPQPTADDVADGHAAQQTEHYAGILALEHAADAHTRAAAAHRSAATLLDRVARHDRAQAHRAAADVDDKGARADSASYQRGSPRTDAEPGGSPGS